MADYTWFLLWTIADLGAAMDDLGSFLNKISQNWGGQQGPRGVWGVRGEYGDPFLG